MNYSRVAYIVPPMIARFQRAFDYAGFRLLPDSRLALLVSFLIGLAFGTYMAVADAVLFREVIPASQTLLLSQLSLLARILAFAASAVLDEILYRMIAVSLLATVLLAIIGLRPFVIWTAILIVAFALWPTIHLSYLASLDPVAMTLAREIMLHGAAGTVWGYLYWRHGLTASIAAHVGAHISLQPLLSLSFF